MCAAVGAKISRPWKVRLTSELPEDFNRELRKLRGSTRRPGQGKRAVTHVRVVEELAVATVCEVQLETGKTHQIRIHLAEDGHPLVGEKVYIRDYGKRGGEPLPSARLLLHAQTLGFLHPVTKKRVQLRSEPPEDFTSEVSRLRARGK